MSNSTSSSGDGGSLAAVKSVAIVVELIAGLVAFVPLYLRQRTNARNQDTVFGMVDAVAGGVFLSISLCSMAKDAAHELGEINEDFPLGFLMVGLGFLTIYLIENAIVPTVLRHVRLDETSRQQLNLQLLDDNDDGDRDDLVKHNDDEAIVADGELPAQSQSQPHQKGYNNVTLYAFTVLAAICVHELFEGLAMGIQNDLSAAVVSLIALAIHKVLFFFPLPPALTPAALFSVDRGICRRCGHVGQHARAKGHDPPAHLLHVRRAYRCGHRLRHQFEHAREHRDHQWLHRWLLGRYVPVHCHGHPARVLWQEGSISNFCHLSPNHLYCYQKWLLTKAGLVTCAFVLMSVMGAFE